MREIKYLVIDVDGTLTDAGIYYDDTGNELKKFCTKDAAGFFVAKKVGIKILILTGRECAATTKRMTEMGVDFLNQNVKNKYVYLTNFMKEYNVQKEELAYIGDDLNDLEPMKLAGYVGCPADSRKEIKEIANYISAVNGGCGVVTDVVEHILEGTKKWEKAISDIYGVGI